MKPARAQTAVVPHDWTHAPWSHPTLDAICCCGLEVHDVGGKSARKVEHRDAAGTVHETIPPCTRGEDVREERG